MANRNIRADAITSAQTLARLYVQWCDSRDRDPFGNVIHEDFIENLKSFSANYRTNQGDTINAI